MKRAFTIIFIVLGVLTFAQDSIKTNEQITPSKFDYNQIPFGEGIDEVLKLTKGANIEKEEDYNSGKETRN